MRVARLAAGQNSTARGLASLSKQKPRPWWGNWRSICVWHCVHGCIMIVFCCICFALGKTPAGSDCLVKTQTQPVEEEIGQEHRPHRTTSDFNQQHTKMFWESHREENTRKEIAQQALRINDTVFAPSDSIRWHRAGLPPQQIAIEVILGSQKVKKFRWRTRDCESFARRTFTTPKIRTFTTPKGLARDC